MNTFYNDRNYPKMLDYKIRITMIELQNLEDIIILITDGLK